MLEVCIELAGAGVVVYRPGTTEVTATLPSREDAIAYARAEWPALGIRVVVTRGARGLALQLPPRCVHCV